MQMGTTIPIRDSLEESEEKKKIEEMSSNAGEGKSDRSNDTPHESNIQYRTRRFWRSISQRANIMNYYTFALLLIIFALIYHYFKKRLNYFKDLDIPHIPAWPIVGNYGDVIIQKRHITEVLQEIYDLSPDAKYVGAFNLTQPIFVIRDLDLVKKVGIKDITNFPGHEPFGDESVDPLFGGNILNLEGQEWKDLRAMLGPMFTSSKMKMMYGLMVDCAKTFVDFIDEQPADKLRMADTEDLFARYTTDVITACAFSIKIDSLRDPNNHFYIYGSKAATVDAALSLKLNLSRIFPGLMKVLKMRIFDKKSDVFFSDVVTKTVKARDEKGEARPDLLQLMMDMRGQHDKLVKVDTQGMTSQAFAFFFAAFETPSAHMCILAHLLALYPDIQAKLREEIDEVMERTNGKPTYSDIMGMLYLEATFFEAMRMHGQVPFLDRVCRVPFELPPTLPGHKPITLEAGSVVWIPVAAIHRDPKYYENPMDFNPERFYGQKIGVNDTTILGFGIGPRSCMGNRFAILESKVLMVHLLHKYTFEANEKTTNPLVYSTKNSFSVHARGGSFLTIKPRNKV